MKIKNENDAIEIFIESSILHSINSLNGESKKANKEYDKSIRAVRYLFNCEKQHLLKLLLSHNELAVQVSAATYLLLIDSIIAEKHLEKIVSNYDDMNSFTAKMVLSEWKNGNLKEGLLNLLSKK